MRNSLKAPLLLTGAVVSFASMSALVKMSGDVVPFMEVVLFRTLLGLPLVALLARNQMVSLKGNNRRLLLIRGVLGTVALIMFFYAVTRISLANALLLNQATPIFVLPLAAMFLGEKITRAHVLLTLTAVLGVALVVKPNAMVISSPSLIALGSALFTALAYITVHKLARTEHYLTIVFWFNSVALAIALPLSLPGFVWPPMKTLFLLVLMAVFATIGQVLLTLGYKYGDAGKLAIIGSLGAVFGACFDYLFWEHLPDGVTIVGGVLVIVSCTLIQMLRALSERV